MALGIGKLGIAALAGAAATWIGVGGALAQKPASLVIYHQLSETQIIPIKERFKAYYEKKTGAPIEISDFFQPGGQLQSTVILEAKGNAVRGDVIILPPDSLMTVAASAPDLLADYTPKSLDDAAVMESVRASSKASTGTIFNLAPFTIVYNTNKVKGADIPDSWLDLLDPKFKNQIGLGDLEQTGGARAPLWFLVRKMGEKGPPWGWDFYTELGKQEPRLFSGHGQLSDQIAAGELTIGVSAYHTTVAGAADGQPIAAVLPKEGAGAQPTAIEVVKKSLGNPAATEFVEWLLSKEGQQAAYDGTKTPPVRSDVTLAKTNFEFDPSSPLIEPVDSKWISETMKDNVAKFRAALRD